MAVLYPEITMLLSQATEREPIKIKTRLAMVWFGELLKTETIYNFPHHELIS